MHGAVHDEPTRTVDLARQPGAIGKRVPKYTRRDDYVNLMYEYREQDGSRYGQHLLVQNQTRLKAKATIVTVLNEYYGITDQMLTATRHGTMFVHSSTGTLYFFVEEAQALISTEG